MAKYTISGTSQGNRLLYMYYVSLQSFPKQKKRKSQFFISFFFQKLKTFKGLPSTRQALLGQAIIYFILFFIYYFILFIPPIASRYIVM